MAKRVPTQGLAAAAAAIYGRTTTREDTVIPASQMSSQIWGQLTPEKAELRRVGKGAQRVR
jgi:hypothetical protein